MWHHSSVNGNIYFWLCLSCAFLDCHVAFESQVRAACCCLSNKSLLKQQIIQFFFFVPPTPASPFPPWQTTHGNHPLSACFRGRLLFTSGEPDDKRPRRAATAAMRLPESRWGWSGKERIRGGGLSSPVQGDLFQRGCVIHNPHPLGWEVGRRCHGEAISQQRCGPRAARSEADGCVRERLTVVEGARWVRCYF